MRIGTIVKSSGHSDYVCQVYGPGEISPDPSPLDYGFGTFVRIEPDPDLGCIVGLVYDTVLLNPSFGSLGPRLSPAGSIPAFTPDYVCEKGVLLGILVVGFCRGGERPVQGVPPVAAPSESLVRRMSTEEVRDFHFDGHGPSLAYLPLVMAHGSPLTVPLLQKVLRDLTPFFPDHGEHFALIAGELGWRDVVGRFEGRG